MMIDTNQKDNSWCGNCVEFKIYVVNKVLLEQDQTHLFNIIYGYFWQTMWLAKLSMFAIRPLKKLTSLLRPLIKTPVNSWLEKNHTEVYNAHSWKITILQVSSTTFYSASLFFFSGGKNKLIFQSSD